jgi:hypothetical protein
MTDRADDLLQEARQRLQGLEQGDLDETDFGERVELAPQDVFRGRWRGTATMRTKNGLAEVGLLWDSNGEPCFIFKPTRLNWELDDAKPSVGDEIAIVRGNDLPSKDPSRNPTQRFAVRVHPSSEPLPGGKQQGSLDDDVPF